MLWVSLGIIVVFGGATLLLHDETFIKWKPTILYWFFSATLIFTRILTGKNLIRSMLQEKMALPDFVWHRLNLSWSAFFAVLGFLNLYIAFNYSTDTWVNFKLFGFTGLMLIFIVVQASMLSKYEEQKKEGQ
jgi:intracellular septation protein